MFKYLIPAFLCLQLGSSLNVIQRAAPCKNPASVYPASAMALPPAHTNGPMLWAPFGPWTNTGIAAPWRPHARPAYTGVETAMKFPAVPAYTGVATAEKSPAEKSPAVPADSGVAAVLAPLSVPVDTGSRINAPAESVHTDESTALKSPEEPADSDVAAALMPASGPADTGMATALTPPAKPVDTGVETVLKTPTETADTGMAAALSPPEQLDTGIATALKSPVEPADSVFPMAVMHSSGPADTDEAAALMSASGLADTGVATALKSPDRTVDSDISMALTNSSEPLDTGVATALKSPVEPADSGVPMALTNSSGPADTGVAAVLTPPLGLADTGVATALKSPTTLTEHESCVDNTNAVGTCKKLLHCESVTEDFKLNGIQPKICTSTPDGTVIVCCRSGPPIPLTSESDTYTTHNSRPTRAGSDSAVDDIFESYTEGSWKNDKDSGYYSCNTNEDGDTSCVIVDASFTSGKKPAEKPEKVTKIGAPPSFMPDNGTGSYYVYSVYNGIVQNYYNSEEDQEKEGGRWGMFFQSEVVIFKYMYKDKSGHDAHVMYYWIGSDVSPQDKKLGQKVAYRKADKLEGETTLVKILQGSETVHFLKMFNNNLIVLRTDEYDQEIDGVRLFRVRGSKKDEDLRVTTLLKKRESLEDDGVFVLDTFGPIYVWRGEDSTQTELDAAIDFVNQFSRTEPPIVTVDENEEPDIIKVEQGKEPQAFWDALLSSSASEQTSTAASVSSSTASVPYISPNILSISSNIPSDSSNIPSVSSNMPSVPSNKPSVPSNIPSVPSNIPSVPSNIPSVPSNIPSVPSNIPSVPSNIPSVHTSTASAIAGRPWYGDIATPVVTRAPSSSVSQGSGNDGFTLYEAIVRLRGAVRFENIPNFTQEDLAQDGAYILDTGEELYLWLGASLPERVKNARHLIIEAYRKRDAVERTEAVFTIPQGREPALFKRIFPSWNPNLFKNPTLSAQAGIYGV